MNTPGTLLITGATGFLGGAVVAELIKQKRFNAFLTLVRAESPENALERLKSNLRLFAIAETDLDNLTTNHVIVGDLGSAEWHQDPRLNQVERVINSAAVASFGNSPRIWAVNHDETLKFAERMAALPQLKRFLHVGTGMACGTQAESPVQESYDIGAKAEHLVPYTHSKATVEAKMQELFPQLPLVVARPSIVVGHTELGCTPSSSIFWVFRMAKALGEFVCDFDDKVDVVPADWTAQALLHLAEKPQLKYKRYHLSAGQDFSNSFREIDQGLSAALQVPPMKYETVDYEQLFARRHEFKTLFGNTNPRMIVGAIKLYGGFSKLNFIFDNARLLSEGMSHPPHFTDYIARCVATTRNQTVAELMMIDFK